MAAVRGIHHVSAIAGNPQRNLDFYGAILGLRLVKRTVNFDSPNGYHLYYGDESGTPGSLITFFPYETAHAGRQGIGQVAVISFAVLPNALGFWIERLIHHGIRFEGPRRRKLGAHAEQVIAFKDPDGLLLEIVAHPGAESRASWGGAKGITGDQAIHGLHTVELWVEDGGPTERVLRDTLGFRAHDEEGGTRCWAVGGGGPAETVKVRTIGGFPRGASGAGTVHHVAWRAQDDAAELALRERVIGVGLQPTEVIDRRYFRSVYFDEPADILFELATEGPGFTVDEPLDRLGERLSLPPWLEPRRADIEAALRPLHPPTDPIGADGQSATTSE